MAEVACDYKEKGVSLIAIGSNDVESYPSDRPKMMKKVAEHHKHTFPYLIDEIQAVAGMTETTGGKANFYGLQNVTYNFEYWYLNSSITLVGQETYIFDVKWLMLF